MRQQDARAAGFGDVPKAGAGLGPVDEYVPPPWLIVLIIALAMAMLFVPLLFFPLFIKGQ